MGYAPGIDRPSPWRGNSSTACATPRAKNGVTIAQIRKLMSMKTGKLKYYRILFLTNLFDRFDKYSTTLSTYSVPAMVPKCLHRLWIVRAAALRFGRHSWIRHAAEP
jgi:hypothetical protein